MKILFDLRKIAALSLCALLASCGGGGGSGGHGDAGGGMSPPPAANTSVNFNATVRALATQSTSPDSATSDEAMDVNTPTWVFEDADDAFDDLFQ